MANNAQNSQALNEELRTKNEELKDASRKFKRVYAFRVSRVNPDFVSFKVWILGYYSKVCSIAVVSLPKIVAQIDTALADGECEFEIGGIRFCADEKLLKSIRKEFSSYCCLGASDANHVPVKPSSDSAESVKKCGAKPKASAPQGSASAARQIYNEERKTKNEELSTPAGVAADVAAIRADLAEMREAQEDFFENLAALLVRIAEVLNDGENAKPKQPRGWQKCAVENPLGGVIRTKRGRTSVVVGVRKISTPKKQK